MDVEQFLKHIPQNAWWLFVFFSAFMENIFPPYPGDSVIVLGGYLWGAGKVSFFSLASAVYAGNIAGAGVMYYFGEHVLDFFRRRFRNKWTQEILDAESLKKTENWFRKWGVIAVILSRFSAGIRFFVAIVAGMFRMNIVVFLLCFSLATLLWNSLLIYGGYVLGENWRKVIEYMQVYNTIIIGLMVTAIAGYILYRRYKKKQAGQP
ncbi:MAG: DedA family protein [Leptospiraceae bacterium]|nr:DedA family protein [Leptospiraceae bacterium]